MYNIAYYVDFPSLIVVLAGLVIAVLITRSLKIFIIGINSLLSKRYQILEENRIQAIRLFHFISKFNLGFAFLVILIDFVAIACNFTELSMFLLNRAVSILTLLYAVFINVFILYPAAYTLENKRTGIKG